MNNYWLFISLYIFAVFISSISQVLLKKSANVKRTSLLKEYLNPTVIIAYGIFFLATLFTIVSYRAIPLSFGPVLESSGYLSVMIMSRIVLKEKVTRRKTIGIGLIVIGILFFTLL